MVRYKARKSIFHQGHQSFGIYCVASGKVKVSSGHNGHEQSQILRIIGPGEIIEFRALISDEPYPTTAVALEHTDVCFIDKQVFFQVLAENPRTLMRVMTTLVREARWLESRRMSLVKKRVRSRLAEILLMLNAKFGKESQVGIRLAVPLMRQELAEMIGATPESVIRAISELKGHGYIQTEGSRITILNLAELTRVANTID